MNIRGIEGEIVPVDPVKGKKSAAPAREASAGKDKVHVSGQARSLFESEQSKRLDEIRNRLNNGYYLSPEVTEKIVNALMVDILKTV
jgi:hypothetical protein